VAGFGCGAGGAFGFTAGWFAAGGLLFGYGGGTLVAGAGLAAGWFGAAAGLAGGGGGVFAGLAAFGAGVGATFGCPGAGGVPGRPAAAGATVGCGWTFPIGAAFAGGGILVTTGRAASAAGGRAEAVATRPGPTTLARDGASGAPAETCADASCCGVARMVAVATGRAFTKVSRETTVTAPGAA
jgi:hypothetical protein